MAHANRTTKDFLERVNALKADRSNWESWWQSLARYCLPRKAEVTERKSSGTEFDVDVYDSTAIEASNLFASGLMGYLTNPNEVWMRLRSKERAVQEQEGVRDFLDRAGEMILRTFQGSNFQEQLHEFYLDYGIFGTAGFYSEPDPAEDVRYYSRPIRELYFEEDSRGRLDTVYRVFELTAKQAVQRWGDNAGTEVLKAAKAPASAGQKFEFIHCVGPRSVRDPRKKDRINKPFFSIWLNAKDAKRVDEGGFEEMPFHVARASKVSGEKQGYSPAMNVLPEIRMANNIARVLIRASMKATDPATLLPHENFLLPLNFNPGAVNYKLQSTGAGSDEQIQFLNGNGNLPAGEQRLLAVQETIKRAFFADLFLMLSQRGKTMTAFEVSELLGERMLILGPLIGRLQNELLQPVIVRTLNILIRSGRLGELPPALAQNPDYRVEYVSVLAKAQALAKVRNIQGFLLAGGELAKIDPEVLDLIDADSSLKEIGEFLGIEAKLLRSDERVAQRRDQRRKQQALAMQIQMAQAMGQAAKTGGEAAQEVEAAVAGAG